jgi:hypothetical protein
MCKDSALGARRNWAWRSALLANSIQALRLADRANVPTPVESCRQTEDASYGKSTWRQISPQEQTSLLPLVVIRIYNTNLPQKPARRKVLQTRGLEVVDCKLISWTQRSLESLPASCETRIIPWACWLQAVRIWSGNQMASD